MKIIDTISELENQLQGYRHKGETIGLVPTMGALHQGHASLVERCVADNKISIVSLFVNPTQFNNKEDLKHYPRTPEKDHELLERLGVDYVFSPSVEEMYPEEDKRVFDFGQLDKVMEGEFRPGHFNGVAQIVSKLFDIVKPDNAYFGEKDFQQLAIVKDMVRQLQMPVNIIGMPIVRESSGLAMSSRNQRLSEEQKKNASEVYKVLNESKLMIDKFIPYELINYVSESINKVSGLKVEYFQIVDGDNLQPVTSWSDSDYIVGCIALFCGEVRLIDNIRYK
ncbi:MAG TPA: pantoate--beta-alanine ligase [Fermentimonas caenicola]|jgi:pantoate--beta-alanine ligase|uniref:pantoate--beta-alanine ligase n=1 Tax=Lascolabacillus TaxID=1924067 RepID=UPI0006B35F52|nr:MULTISPECIES: pantoate--beta-alanine ligase [Lascolabacillus]MBP6175161.1 pantoate--beta-alanine ligase [Fermentimonas sp.]MDI9626682.1 pantoate--beta-alanine ligase [Bacteroidota bacterium]TAH62139.1 MAG: pantoate--beta-alanine ligase [Fermentimonas caenicola]MBP6196545.1 pantoate--beta-alanine ligase [Fermentimonas sp.]MDD2606950.1 pantoate--beta-alanine ligase [Lascolabacillus sp.]